MSEPLDTITTFLKGIHPNDQWKIVGIGLIPVVNNVFLEIQKRQLIEKDRESLQKIVSLISIVRLGHFIIYGALLAKIMEYLSFKWRFATLISIATYYVGLGMHIEQITLEARKNP